jgi:hypothetical protein
MHLRCVRSWLVFDGVPGTSSRRSVAWCPRRRTNAPISSITWTPGVNQQVDVTGTVKEYRDTQDR